MVERGLFESRAKARAAIEAGGVIADGATVAKASDLINEAAVIAAEPAHPWVSRAALKLIAAFEQWAVDPDGKTVLDIGASTGGFTEVCLARGAARVFAVDVGRSQLHPRLRRDERVVSLEGTDARSLTAEQISEPPQLIVCDASFIGLSKVLPAALKLAAPGADLVCLVKPQFEVGPEHVGKGGIVRDEAMRQAAVDQVKNWLEHDQGWRVLGERASPITGSDGNAEFLVWARDPTW